MLTVHLQVQLYVDKLSSVRSVINRYSLFYTHSQSLHMPRLHPVIIAIGRLFGVLAPPLKTSKGRNNRVLGVTTCVGWLCSAVYPLYGYFVLRSLSITYTFTNTAHDVAISQHPTHNSFFSFEPVLILFLYHTIVVGNDRVQCNPVSCAHNP